MWYSSSMRRVHHLMIAFLLLVQYYLYEYWCELQTGQ